MSLLEQHDSRPNATTTVVGRALDGTVFAATAKLGDSTAIRNACTDVADRTRKHDAYYLALYGVEYRMKPHVCRLQDDANTRGIRAGTAPVRDGTRAL